MGGRVVLWGAAEAGPERAESSGSAEATLGCVLELGLMDLTQGVDSERKRERKISP